MMDVILIIYFELLFALLKHLEISHFTHVYQNLWSYTTLFLRCSAWRMLFFYFLFFFVLLFALLKHLEISLFYPCVPKIRIRWCMVPEIVTWRRDWWMNGEVTYRGGALHCFSLKIYGFCSSSALYSESLQRISTRMFDTFDNWDHYFEWNLSLELLIKVFFYKKACNVVS